MAFYVVHHRRYVDRVTLNLVNSSKQLCPLHKAKLLQDRVPICYELSGVNPNKQDLFPYANEWVVESNMPRKYIFATVQYCPICRTVESEWENTRLARPSEASLK